MKKLILFFTFILIPITLVGQDKFIELARAVYVTNDERSRIKKDINITNEIKVNLSNSIILFIFDIVT